MTEKEIIHLNFPGDQTIASNSSLTMAIEIRISVTKSSGHKV